MTSEKDKPEQGEAEREHGEIVDAEVIQGPEDSGHLADSSNEPAIPQSSAETGATPDQQPLLAEMVHPAANSASSNGDEIFPSSIAAPSKVHPALSPGAGYTRHPTSPVKPHSPLEPHVPTALYAKISLAIGALASFLFFFVFIGERDFRLRSDGIAERPFVDLVSLSILVTGLLFAVSFFRVKRRFAHRNARIFTSFALTFAIAGGRWLFPSLDGWGYMIWMLFVLAAAVSIYFVPRSQQGEDETLFHVDDSLAANGGAISALVLGCWAIFGAMFTGWSVVNAFLGIALGLWGLTSRKKLLATLGIALCCVGIMACMLNLADNLSSIVFYNPSPAPTDW